MRLLSMGILSLAGVKLPKPGDDTAADRAIRQALELAACAHKTLRDNLRTDPAFAPTICQALGCNTGACAEGGAMPHLERRAERITRDVERLASQPATSRPALRSAG
jgi:hypothetical protein